MKGRACLVLLWGILGCGRPNLEDENGCEDWDADGVCDQVDVCPDQDDLEDANDDGTPDVDEDHFLHTFEIPRVIFDTISKEIEITLGYGQEGQAHTEWESYEPPLAVHYSGDQEVYVRTCTLGGWDDVEAHMVDGDDGEMLGIWMEGTTDGEGRLQLWQEPSLDMEMLSGARIRFMRLEAVDWTLEPDSTTLGTLWTFYGTPRPH